MPDPPKGGVVLSRGGQLRAAAPPASSAAAKAAFDDFVASLFSGQPQDWQSESAQGDQRSMRCKWRVKMEACVDSSPVLLLQPAGSQQQGPAGKLPADYPFSKLESEPCWVRKGSLVNCSLSPKGKGTP